MSIFREHLERHRAMIEAMVASETLAVRVQEIGKVMIAALERGNKILWFGNGGSAADAQHLSTELVVRYTKNRRGLPSVALTTDTSARTAAGNDFGFEQVFARQVEALGQPGDVAIGISTSGTSENVIKGLESAKAQGLTTIAFVGNSVPTSLQQELDLVFSVPSTITAHIQEAHILCGHVLCDICESHFAVKEAQDCPTT